MKKLLSVILCSLLALSALSFTVGAESGTEPETAVLSGDPAGTFDEDNIILTFGVTSDTHLSGSWNQVNHTAKLGHMLEAFQKAARDEGVSLDAILVNGDFIDGVANGGSNVQATSSYGLKAAQNFREVSLVSSVLEGKNTSLAAYANDNNATAKLTGAAFDNVRSFTGSNYGSTIYGSMPIYNTDTKLFYALGNHDESGAGIGTFNKTMTKGVRGESGYVNTVYSAEYFAAVFCGWQYNYQSAMAQSKDDGYDDEYIDYIMSVYDMYTSPLASKKDAFEAKYSYISAEDALERFSYYYGDDTDFTREDFGLFYGNRHMTIGEGNDKIHFIAIELSQNSNSLDFLDRWCAQSVAENPNKPIFVLSHLKILNTIYGSYDGKANMDPILAKYPQVIVWGGDSHTPIHSENAIMQKDYTVVESGVLGYLSMAGLLKENLSAVPGIFKNHPSDAPTRIVPVNQFTHENHDEGLCCYVQVDGDFNVRIKRLETYRSYNARLDEDKDGSADHPNEAVFVKDPWIISSYNKNEYVYTSDRSLDANNPAPVFASDASVLMTPVYGGTTKVTFDAATDDDMVKYYFVRVYRKNSPTIIKTIPLTSMFTEVSDQAELLAKYPSYSCSIDGLDDNTEYTVTVTAYDVWDRASEEKTCILDDSGVVLYRIDGILTCFLDTSDSPVSKYSYNGSNYNVLTVAAEAGTCGADKIVLVNGDVSFTDVNKSASTTLEIVGINQSSRIYWNGGTPGVLNRSIIFRNLTLDALAGGDAGLTVSNLSNNSTNTRSLTIDNCVTLTNIFHIFGGGWGKYKSGSLTITGNSGPFNSIFPGPNFGASHGLYGDYVLNIEGGTFNGTVGSFKNQTGNFIDGNVIFNISGGTFKSTVAPSTTGVTNISGNAVMVITGGDFTSATIGHTGTSNVDGKEIYVVANSVYQNRNNAGKFQLPSNASAVILPDDEGGIADYSLDGSGFISKLTLKSVSGKYSVVNGSPATEIVPAAGTRYTVEYLTAKTISFDANLPAGETLIGTLPETLGGMAGTAAVIPACDIGTANYRFLGWATTNYAVAPETSFTFGTTDIVLYAVWEGRPSHTVTLVNGGSGCPASFTGVVGVECTLPEGTKSGYTFTGWSTVDGEKIGKKTIVLSEDVDTLYACYAIVVYVDGKSGGSGSLLSPYSTLKSAVTSTNFPDDGVVVVMGALVNDRDFGSLARTITFTSIDPVTGHDYRDDGAMLTFKNALYPKNDCTVFENINFFFYSTGYTYINASGKKCVIGENVNIVSGVNYDTSVQQNSSQKLRFRGGSDGWNGNSTCLEFRNNTDCIAEINLASQSAGTVYGDVNGIFNGGQFSGNMNLGNNGGSTATIGGNVNLVVNSYSGDSLKTNMSGVIGTAGAVNFIFNNGTYDKIGTVSLSTSSCTIDGGVYTIKSSEGGHVEAVPTVVTNNVASDTHGKFIITTEMNTIYVNGAAIPKSDDDIYDLGEEGVYEITYANVEQTAGVSGSVLLARAYGDSFNDDASLGVSSEGLITVTSGETVVCEIPESEMTVSDKDGSVLLSFEAELTSGSYALTFTKNGYLSFTESFTVGSGNVTLPTCYPTAGDIKGAYADACGDGKVDVNDFIRVVRGFAVDGNTKLGLTVDINEDGAVTVADLALVKSSFGESNH